MDTTPRDPDPRAVALGSAICAARKAADMTQAALAEALGVKPHTVSRYESGETWVSGVQLMNIEAALGVEAGSLMAGAQPSEAA